MPHLFSFAGVARDLRYSLRLLRRQPRQAAIMILTLALGIGATTVLMAVAHGVLVEPLGWPEADRVVVLKETRGGNAPRFGAFSNAALLAWRDEAATLEAIAAWSPRVLTLTGAGDPERIRAIAATPALFPVLGARPMAGTVFHDSSSPSVVLAERLWRQRFAADPAILGRTVELDGRAYAVIGVLGDGQAFPDRETLAIIPADVPLTGLTLFNAVARLRPGASPAQASAEGTARGRFAPGSGPAAIAIFGSDGPVTVSAQPLTEALTGDVQRPLLVMLAAVVLLLITATANCAGLQLVRAGARAREVAIRAALGAAPSRLTRQLLVESLVIGLAGGTAGVLLAAVLQRWAPAILPADFPRLDAIGLDPVVVAAAALLSVAASTACGVLPARRVRRLNQIGGLGAHGMGAAQGEAGSRPQRSRMVIMTLQVATACVLLIGASLLGRSFLALVSADRGYDPSGVLSARLSMPASLYPSVERRLAMVDAVLERLSNTPGVLAAAFTSESPLAPGGSTTVFNLRTADGVLSVQASPRLVSPAYFAALKIPVVAGRTFTADDTRGSEPVAVVNREFARRFLADAAVGAKLPVTGYGSADGREVEATVVGVVDTVRYIAGAERTQPEVYYPHVQMQGRLPVQTVTLMIRTAGDPSSVAGVLRASIGGADARLVADVIMPLEQRLAATLAHPRLYAWLVGALAVCAFAIAAVGLFGVLSYSASLRSRELAIRAALGATRGTLLRLMLRQGLTIAIAGTTAGGLAAAWLSRALDAQLYAVTSHDPVTFMAVPLFVMLCSVLTCLVPALGAARQDPLTALRESS